MNPVRRAELADLGHHRFHLAGLDVRDVHLDAAGSEFRLAVNVLSQESPSELLYWADEAFAVNPHKPLLDMARKKGWSILDWR